ncbi:MAG: DUF4956 domain-containing protein [Lachnoclostridium sp.]|nr:DUF4956 domain-containing protein [Lachnospira sp.]MCM1246978.1 DUF4956 domain-containing protein [Lachnoclostridium sp.]MCM1535031.1 DUF4956 domain-containing protein [Clostridium sp.]
MLNTLFRGIFDTNTINTINISQFLLCMGSSILIGIFLALAYRFKARSTQSFLATLALLPAIVCVIIMMVNGNVGTGVAVAGAFSLVRFRSAPGTAREIGAIFLAMGAGLMTGMGYLGYAFLFSLILGGLMVLLNCINFGRRKSTCLEKSLHITIPEDLNYEDVFQDLLEEYTSRHEMISVKTTNMGSLFKLHYHVTLKNNSGEKEFLDALRCRNANLEISLTRQEDMVYEL